MGASYTNVPADEPDGQWAGPAGRGKHGAMPCSAWTPAAIAITLGLAIGFAIAAGDCEGLPGVRCDGDGRLQYSSPPPRLRSVQTLGGAFATNNNPATWGAITFHGDGSRCIGLLRRGACQ